MRVKIILIILSIFISGVISACAQKTAIPRNLDEAILYFKQHWTKTELDNFKYQKEDLATTNLHFSTGLWIRNNWIRGKRNNSLCSYFNKLGISNPDDISTVILTSLHRTLNGKKIDLDKQVEIYSNYAKSLTECEKKNERLAVANFNKFKIGDRISIYMPVSKDSDGSRYATIYNCPNTDWTFVEKNDLKIVAKVVKKYNINSPTNVFFTVKIMMLNRNDTEIFMQKVKVGSNYNFSLSGLTIR